MLRPKTVKLELTSTPSFPQTRLICFQQVNFGSLHNHARCVQDSECQGRLKHFAQTSKKTESAFTEIFQSVMVVSFTTLVHFMIHFCPPFIPTLLLLHAHIRTYVPLVKNLIRSSTRIILTTRYSTSICTKTTKLQKKCGPF